VLIDGRQVDDGERLTFDLVVVGAGMAGISLVDRLRSTGLRICLIAGGGFSTDLQEQRLYGGERAGLPYFRLDACRYREFGGNGNHWGGWCWPLNPIDFAQRDWLPWSGWPLEPAELEPFYAAAADLLQLPTSRFDAAGRPQGMPAPLEIANSDFESAFVQYSPATNFGAAFRDRIISAERVTTMLHAHVTELLLDADGRSLESVQVRTLAHNSFRVHGRVVVLATGAIENARLLLVSRRARDTGIGNEHDIVGRFFMEHLHTPAGHLRAREKRIDHRFYRKASYDGKLVRGVLTPTMQAQVRHRLPACSVAIEETSFAYGTPFDGWAPALRAAPDRAYLELERHGYPQAAARFKGAVDHVWRLRRLAETARSARSARRRDVAVTGSKNGHLLSLYVRSEQVPNPSSRVSLSGRKDALGGLRPRLEWRLEESDTLSVMAWMTKLDEDLRREALGHVIAAAEGWEEKIIGGPHHIGTTRMSADPKAGVVDAQCRVHSVDNLYVAGSSVFTTGGHANPSFTLIALALRLADELQRVLERATTRA
jgi:choline dehydrogenase-like flavoprotein